MRRCRSLRWYTRLVRVRIALWIHHYRRLDVHLYSSLPLSLIVRLSTGTRTFLARVTTAADEQQQRQENVEDDCGIASVVLLLPLLSILLHRRDRRARARWLHRVVALTLVRVHVIRGAEQGAFRGLEGEGRGCRIRGAVYGPRVVCNFRVGAARVGEVRLARAALLLAHAQPQGFQRARVQRRGLAPRRRPGQKRLLQHALLPLGLAIVPASALDAVGGARTAARGGRAPRHGPVRGRAPGVAITVVRPRLPAGTAALRLCGTGRRRDLIGEEVADGRVDPRDSHHVPRLPALVVHGGDDGCHRAPDAGNRSVRLGPRVPLDLVQTLEEGVVLVEGNHRSFQAGFVVIEDLRVDGARLAGERTERRLAHAVAEAHHEKVLVGVRALPRRDRGRWILIRLGPLSVRDQNISRVTSRLVVLHLGVVNELERPFEPFRHVGTATGVEPIDELAESGFKIRHRAGQRGETRVGRGNGTELHDADEIRERHRVKHSLRRPLQHADAIVARHAARYVKDQYAVLGAGRGGHVPGSNARVVVSAAVVVINILVPDNAGEVDEDAVFGPVEEPLGVALLDHAVVHVGQVGADVFGLTRGALDGVVTREQLWRGFDDAVLRVDGSALVAAAPSGVAIIEVAERIFELGATR